MKIASVNSSRSQRALWDGLRPCQGTVVMGPAVGFCLSNLEDHRHNQRPARRVPDDETLQVLSDLLLDHAVVALLFVTGGFERAHHRLAGLVEEAVLARAGSESAHNNLGRALNFSGQLVDGDDGQHNTILA